MMGSPIGTRPPQDQPADIAGACASLHEGQDAMNGNSVRQTVRVTNPNGFHLRPMKDFVELARRFECAVRVSRDDRTADGKSIFELMGMLTPQGSELLIEASGADAREAVAALVGLIEKSNTADDEPPLPPKG
jgi:phosphotransferase system HPr (HPr) family protein